MSSVFSLAALAVPSASGAPSIFVEDRDGGYVDLTPEWFDGHPEVSDDPLDVAAFSDAGHRAEVALQDAALSFSFFVAPGTAGTSAWEVVTGLLRNNGTAHSIIYYPRKLADSEIRFPSLRCVRVSINGQLGEAETFDAEFALDGTYEVLA